MTPSIVRVRLAVVASLLMASFSHAQPMLDPKNMSGVPLPVGDLPAGSVIVRVIRGTLANNVAGHPVDLVVDGTPRRQNTNASGRAEFSGLHPGVRVKASVVIDGERLDSQEFPVPAAGGIRLLLVASDPGAAAPTAEGGPAAAPASDGVVVLGEQSRFVFELGDEGLNVFSILQIVNTSGTPVQPRQPVVFESSSNGGTVTVLNGSSPRAAAEGRRVVVTGPFPPGPTLVQFGYSVPYSGPNVTVEQRMPVALNQVTVMAQKVGDMRLASPHLARHREMSAQGATYIVGQGPGVQPGGAVSFSFSGLPYAPTWPRNVALALATVILAGGAWSSFRRRDADSGDGREALEARRDRLFSELTAIEQRHRAGGMDAADHSERRRQLITELESVYAALDN
jgi:hypothetical protein